MNPPHPLAVSVERLPEGPFEGWAPGSLFRTRAWLNACHRAGDSMLCVRTSAGDALLAGRLVAERAGWANMNIVDICSGTKYGVRPPPEQVEEARDLAVPHLLMAVPGYDTGVIGNPSAGTASALVASVEEVAGALDVLPVYGYVPALEVELLAALRAAGYLVGAVTATARLELTGMTFDDYLASLSHKRRWAVRHELMTFERAGGHVTVFPASSAGPLLPEVARLEANVLGRHGRRQPPAVFEDLHRRMSASFGDDMLVVVALHDGRQVASATLLVRGTEMHVRSAGIDYEAAPAVHGHFVAVYYVPIQLAYARGVRTVWFGISGFRAKVNRGARLVGLHAAVPSRSPAALLHLLQRTDGALRRSLPWADGGA